MNKLGTWRRQAWIMAAATLCAVVAVTVGCINVRIVHEGSPGVSSSGPSGSTPNPGGNFVPVQGQPVGQTETTICSNPVSGTKTTFTTPTTTQVPPAGKTGFVGSVLNVTTGATIPNTNYYLHIFVNSINKGCCQNVPGSSTLVSSNVTAGLPYRFTAFFKTGFVPPAGHVIQLSGQWTPP
jgi:hypothetical protein